MKPNVGLLAEIFSRLRVAASGTRSVRVLGIPCLLAIAVVCSGCAGAKIEPTGLILVKSQTEAGSGTFWMLGPKSGEVTFEIVKQTLVGASAGFFEVKPTCEGKTYKVKAEELEKCDFQVAAKAGVFTSGLKATLETEWRFAGEGLLTITNPVEMQ
jgi:hypothetical protein